MRRYIPLAKNQRWRRTPLDNRRRERSTIPKSICVNITTEQADSDTSCKLNKGDHRFVRHASVIYYKDAREIDLALVEKALSAGIKNFICTAHDPVRLRS